MKNITDAKEERCKLCGSHRVQVTYYGAIRAGGLGRYMEQSVPMFQCENCGVIWHDPVLENIDRYYESEEYRSSMGEESNEEVFYRNHDNVLGWCLEKRPKADIQAPFFQREIDAVWRSSCAFHQMADYVVLYAKK